MLSSTSLPALRDDSPVVAPVSPFRAPASPGQTADVPSSPFDPNIDYGTPAASQQESHQAIREAAAGVNAAVASVDNIGKSDEELAEIQRQEEAKRIAEDPENQAISQQISMLYVVEGEAYFRNDNIGSALKSFETAITFNPDNHTAQYNCGVILVEQFNQAGKSLNEMADLDDATYNQMNEERYTTYLKPALAFLYDSVEIFSHLRGGEHRRDDETTEVGDGMMMSDGDWAAWLTLDGYDAEIIVQSGGDSPPEPPANLSDGAVWNLAKWSIENSGSDEVEVVNPEYYACPFVPATDRNTHSFYPTLYQKKTKADNNGSDDSWYMKVYYGNVHDLHKGQHHRVDRCDNETEIAVKSGEEWYLKMKTDNLGVPEELEITSQAPEVMPFQPPEAGVTDDTPDEGKGTYKWKLFEIMSAGDKLVARIFHSGDISWYRWLHDNLLGDSLPTQDEQARVYKKFNQETYKHEFRHILAGTQIKVLESEDSITISWVSEGEGGGG